MSIVYYALNRMVPNGFNLHNYSNMQIESVKLILDVTSVMQFGRQS